MDIIAYALSRKYTEDTAIGLGAVRGKNCTIESIAEVDGGANVVFKWTGDDGTVQNSTLFVQNGLSVVNIEVNDDNTITCVLSDGSSVTSSTAIKGGDSTLADPLTANVAIGNVTSGKNYPAGTSLEDIVRDMLVQYIKPSVMLTLNPATALYDAAADSVASITLNAAATKQSSNIAKVDFYVNGSLVNTVTSGITNGGNCSYIYAPAAPITTDTDFRAVVTDVDGGTGVSTKSIAFIGQSYYGIVGSDVDAPTADEVKALSKTLKNTNDYTYSNITMDFQKIVYAYPASLGALTSILDANNIQYLNSYTRQDLTIDGIAYYVYVLTNASAVTGFTQKYS